LADTLTDALRAAILRQVGYRVDVVEFVDSVHTPRNTLLRAVRTGSTPPREARDEYDALVSTWHLQPRLAELLDEGDPH
ncbi:MAG: SAM-dependent methyltransferase, partial [Marmoricola sp.]|nr:SAM-dependent methyltransferase [Marmoricola sp.]